MNLNIGFERKVTPGSKVERKMNLSVAGLSLNASNQTSLGPEGISHNNQVTAESGMRADGFAWSAATDRTWTAQNQLRKLAQFGWRG